MKLSESNVLNVTFDSSECDEFSVNESKIHCLHAKNTNFSGLNVMKAVIEHSIFDCCSLVFANFYEITSRSINFLSSKMTGCSFSKSTLIKSKFFESKCINLSLSMCQLTYNVVVKCDFTLADFTKSTLFSVKFDQTNLKKASMSLVNAEDVTMIFCDLFKFGAHKASFLRLNIAKCHLKESSWCNTKIDESDFSEVQGLKSSFFNSEIKRSNFYRARLVESGLSGAFIYQCNFTSANLLNSELSKASCIFTSFLGANLFNCGFYNARFVEVNIKDALTNKYLENVIDKSLAEENHQPALVARADQGAIC
ncbi:pentapeptide repeat-containing protein [Piscirickettsia salmonis]